MKFTKEFTGATGGNPFAQKFAVGDECPDDLVEAAKADGAIDAAPQNKSKPDTKPQFNSKG